VGRLDFTLFPVAGYLCLGRPDINALLLAQFFYPMAMAHLGVNDIVDVANDQARGLKTIPTLFGMERTAYWILAFTLIHFVTAAVFMSSLGTVGIVGLVVGLFLLGVANVVIMKKKTAEAGLRALPMFHLAMLVYAVSIIASYWI
jgi:4-hydroxybenzoate polyprenyltransferase